MVPSIYIPGTTPHCLVSTEGNVNFLGTRNLVYSSSIDSHTRWILAQISRLSYVFFLSFVSVTSHQIV